MRKLVAIIAILFSTTLIAQSPAKVIHVELGGPGLASLNYDMRFKGETGLGFRAGLGGFSLGTSSDKASVVLIPLGLNYVLGKGEKNYFELGAGVTPVISKSTVNSSSKTFRSTFSHLNIGYRVQPADGGFFFRVAVNPIFGKGFFWPIYGGVSFGYKL
jgi:hypothetical protein